MLNIEYEKRVSKKVEIFFHLRSIIFRISENRSIYYDEL